MWRWFCLALIAWAPCASALDRDALAALLDDVRAEMKMPGVRAAVGYLTARSSARLSDLRMSRPISH